MKKRIFKTGAFILCAMLTVAAFVGCGGNATYLATDELEFYSIEGSEAAVLITGEDNIIQDDNGKVITLTVPAGTQKVEVDLAVFLAKEGVLGKKFNYSRSDESGIGYAYEQHSTDETKWKKVGTEDSTAKIATELAAGPKIFVEDGERQPIYFTESNNSASPAAFKPAGRTFRVTFKSHDGKTYKLHIIIKAAEA